MVGKIRNKYSCKNFSTNITFVWFSPFMNNEIFTKTSDLNIHERNHTDEIENIFMAYFLVSLFMKGENNTNVIFAEKIYYS